MAQRLQRRDGGGDLRRPGGVPQPQARHGVALGEAVDDLTKRGERVSMRRTSLKKKNSTNDAKWQPKHS